MVVVVLDVVVIVAVLFVVECCFQPQSSSCQQLRFSGGTCRWRSFGRESDQATEHASSNPKTKILNYFNKFLKRAMKNKNPSVSESEN